MSKNILVVTEIKNEKTNLWEMIKDSESLRNISPIKSILTSPRGVPIDSSNDFITLYNSKKNRICSSYFYLKELKLLRSNSEIDESFLEYIDLLEELEIERISCHNCIRTIFLITYK